ncbi:MAG TPA: hypothetical protein PKU96_04460 [bacterium]|nr:hypothetical protein [Myxococcales bacterium]OQA61908.1 MAG: hypothetical protein BWY40_00379 [bacterium ADurb.Bin270]HPW45605.1 hypothetical protein [bacterium]HQG13624.1 hypothetical protein [bacterium]
MRSSGFTMIELVLVMGMLVVIAALFISYTGDIGNVSVDSLSRKIQSDIRFAQQMATSKGSPHGVKFTQGGGYTVYDGIPSNPAIDPFEKNLMVENVSDFGSIALANNFQVEFNKLGKPTMGGGGNIEVLADSGARRRIYVIENTGAVLIDILDYGTSCSCRMCVEDR